MIEFEFKWSLPSANKGSPSRKICTRFEGENRWLAPAKNQKAEMNRPLENLMPGNVVFLSEFFKK